MGFLTNKTVNLINLQAALFKVANDLVFMFFGPIFLFQQGVSVPWIAIAFALFFILRLSWRTLLVPTLVRTFGVRNSAIIGAFIFAATVLLLSQSQGLDLWFGSYIVLGALGNGIYWTTFHTLYANSGDQENRGKQIAVYKVLTIIFMLMGTLGGAWIVKNWGFQIYFGLCCLTMCISGALLLRIPNTKDLSLSPLSQNIWKKVGRRAFHLFMFSGFWNHAHAFLWVIILFMTVGNITQFGLALAVGVLAQVIFQLFIGHRIDTGKLQSVNNWGIGLMATTIIGRCFWAFSFPVIMLFEALYTTAMLLWESAFSATFYNESKQSKQPFWFQFFGEAGFDIGSAIALSLLALFAHFNTELRPFMLIAFFGLYGSWRLIYQKSKAQMTK